MARNRKIVYRGIKDSTCNGELLVEVGERKPVNYNYYDGMPTKELARHERRLNRDIQHKKDMLGINVEEQQPITYIYFTRVWDKVKELSVDQARDYVNNGYKVFALDSNGITYSVSFKGLELTLNKED